tara:strand:+ start:5332 stop:6489 length:1158 start_codon:yes stop_codon:yes gene_type:complete
MKLLIITHKEVTPDLEINNSYKTSGGFPFQINSISNLFSNTSLICLLRTREMGSQLAPIVGKNFLINTYPEPLFSGHFRHIAFLFWLPIHFKSIFKQIKKSDAVHSLIPGDIGLLGLLIALWVKKPIFVRHCGTWGNMTTLADRFIYYLLPKIAKGKIIVMATGGGEKLPETKNKNINWIFSTSITHNEWNKIKPAKPWIKNQKLRLISVSRLTKGKNIKSAIEAIFIIKKSFSNIHLDIIGDGEEKYNIRKYILELGLNDNVTLHGNISHLSILERLSNSHIFVFPTNIKEGFPKVLIEAMSCGLPSIATRVSVIPYLIENKCGIILEKTNAISVSQAILLLISNINQMSKMGKKAREISKEYTLEKWSNLISNRLEKSWGPLK